MKEIIAIIRPNKVTATKKALDRMGFPGMSVIPVFGRGKQKGIAVSKTPGPVWKGRLFSECVKGNGLLHGQRIRV